MQKNNSWGLFVLQLPKHSLQTSATIHSLRHSVCSCGGREPVRSSPDRIVGEPRQTMLLLDGNSMA